MDSQLIKLQNKPSGVYSVFEDRSQLPTPNVSNNTPLVIGFSKKGIFNTPIYIPDADFFVSVFGNIDTQLERSGSFFHRTCLTMLQEGGVLALNIYDFKNEVPDNINTISFEDNNYDITEYVGLSTGSTINNIGKQKKTYVTFYNRDQFWFPDTKRFLSAAGNVNSRSLLNFVNLNTKPVTILVKKSQPQNFNIKARDWYANSENMPEYLHPDDYISDFFVDVYIFDGDYSDYNKLSSDALFGKYFDAQKGLRKKLLNEFANLSEVKTLAIYSGCLIPDFQDKNGINFYIETLINQDTSRTGLFCAVDLEKFDTQYLSGRILDLVGHNIEKATNDESLTSVNFLSYNDTIISTNYYRSEPFTNNIIPTLQYNTTIDSTNFINVLQVTTGAGFNINNETGMYLLTDGNSITGQGFYVSHTQGVGYVSNPVPINGQVFVANNFNLWEFRLALGVYSVVQQTIFSNDILTIRGKRLRVGLNTPFYTNLVNTFNGVSNLSNAKTGFILVNSNLYAKIEQVSPINIPFGFVDLIISDDYTNTIIGNGTTGTILKNISFTDIKTEVVLLGSVPTNYQYYQSNEGTLLSIAIQEGVLVDGDIIKLQGVNEIDRFIKIENSNAQEFIYSNSYIPSNKVQTYKIKTYLDSSLNESIRNTSVVPFTAFVGQTGLNIKVQTLKGSLNESFNVEFNPTTPYKFVIDISLAGKIKSGHYILSEVGYQDISTYTPSRMVKVLRISQTPNPLKLEVICDGVVYFKNSTMISTNLHNGLIERYFDIESFVDYFNMFSLVGFKVKNRMLPNTDSGDVNIYETLTKTNIYNTLKNKRIIKFRYIIDTFNKGLTSSSKSILTALAYARIDCFAILNSPSIEEFSRSTDPRFTQLPTVSNPFPSFVPQYMTTNGNPNVNSSNVYNLPNEQEGGQFGAFFTPNLIIRERGKDVSVPPSIFVALNFIRKIKFANSFDIIAGNRRGVLSGKIIGVEYEYTDDDRGYLENWGLNTIINDPQVGFKITSNSTSYQKIKSSLSKINATEVLIDIVDGMANILNNFVGEFNNSQNRLEIKTLADSFLESIKIKGGVYDYQNVMNTSNNTTEVIDNSFGVIDTYIEVVKGMEKIVHRTTLLRTGQISTGNFL